MAYFHAQIVLKDQKAGDLFEYDLSEEYARVRIVNAYVSGIPFFFGGASVRPEAIQRLRVVKTDKPANEVGDTIVQSARRNRVMMGINMAKESIIENIRESVDVTRELIDAAQHSGFAKIPNEAVMARQRPTQVFIVYGHDANLLNELELALRRWNIEPVVLSEKPNLGMTLVQKVEVNADVGFAFVLVTPDDYGGTDIGRLQRRARQNVIWEWGYLVGRLGREHVCCIYKEGVELPSDLHGIATVNVRTDLKANLEELRRELKGAGFEIR